jgi:hypothetical protein
VEPASTRLLFADFFQNDRDTGRKRIVVIDLGRLRAEIEEYEQLRSGQVAVLEGASLGELASLLVKARFARRWTQRQLADALGIAEQQVQRYEATGYRSASLVRICDVAAALKSQHHGSGTPKGSRRRLQAGVRE